MPRPSPQPPSLCPITIHPGTTRLCFWIQTVAACLAAARSPDAISDFRSFLLDGATAPLQPPTPPELAGLLASPSSQKEIGTWLTHACGNATTPPPSWRASRPMGLFVPPDVRRLPSFVIAA
ncbi:hypothetical protein HK405_015129 [Cladochytrium tenue]|nr:hypothetical protein HK405_015129 [Cladochytrium tenue]